MKKILLVAGTRPNFIKLWSLGVRGTILFIMAMAFIIYTCTIQKTDDSKYNFNSLGVQFYIC